MSQVILKGSLSRNSFLALSKEVTQYKKNFNKALQLGVKEASEEFLKMVRDKCDKYNLSDHKDNIILEDISTNKNVAYKIYTNDIVLIFHEHGTGIEGKQDGWASSFQYTVNMSGKGEKGWYFFNEKGNYGGITHGLTTKHIFYECLRELEPRLANKVQIGINQQLKNYNKQV